jgi:tubulin--tyrosine ligase
LKKNGVASATAPHYYKYVVGKGNNSILISMCMKGRFWWCKGDWDDFTFAWS